MVAWRLRRATTLARFGDTGELGGAGGGGARSSRAKWHGRHIGTREAAFVVRTPHRAHGANHSTITRLG